MVASPPPSCPACGSTSLRLDGGEPLWRCDDCEHQFLELSPTTWRDLLRSMLPNPIVETEVGIIGGDPPEVIVRLSDDGLELAAYRAEMRGDTPVVNAKKWKVFDLDTGPSEVATAIQKARARRLRTYRWCVGCRRVLPPEQMLDSVTCRRCADD